MSLADELKKIADIDIFEMAKKKELFVGRPYYLDYDKAYILITDAWKEKVHGVPQGCFLLAFYENAKDNSEECLLLRTLRPSKLPTDNAVISSMVEYYKDNLKTSGSNNQLDDYTKYTFSFSGLECRILGTFYKGQKNKVTFGADVENFYSAHNYVVYKPIEDVLEKIVNFRDGNSIVGGNNDIKIGTIRYSSSLRFQESDKNVPVYITPQDFLGKRTALFGMTRTGKSNTVKKIIDATTEISKKAKTTKKNKNTPVADNLKSFDDYGNPKFPVGQIIFDINGEYANANMQDSGTAIFEKYKDLTSRYSVLEKNDFKILKVNFYSEIEAGFDLICNTLEGETGDYIKSFLAIDFTKPEKENYGDDTRWQRKIAAYQCCLYKAGYEIPSDFKLTFQGKQEINSACKENGIDPSKGINIDDAVIWFTWVAENYNTNQFFDNYKKKEGKEWLDEDLKAILVMLTQKRDLSARTKNISGYNKLVSLNKYHTNTTKNSFTQEILDDLKNGKIVIIDLSQGDPKIQQTFSEKICKSIFQDSMNLFVNNEPNNFIQFYFEEAHNLFPKKDDKDLSQIYNRIAKEGAKLNLGMIYATQEVSSISSNILKNTQNWFIAHLNNDDEIKEIRKFYDFEDFCESLIKYSSGSDKGFIRMKTYSNAFIVPVQIDRFTSEKKVEKKDEL